MTEILELFKASETDQMFEIANGVQNAVESGRWAYLAVIVLFLVIEFNKKTIAKKYPSVKKNAAQYSAGLGATAGAVLSQDDPISGAVGGMMVGNAASGLASMLKPFMGAGFLQLLPLALRLTNQAYKAMSGLSKEEKKAIIKEFDDAKEKTKGENASTKELEEWYSKHL